jgi:hypothetical protein
MKKLVLILSVTTFLVSLVGCSGGGKYADAKKVLGEVIDLTKEYISGIEKVENAQDYVAVLNKYGEGMKALKPKFMELEKKYNLKGEEPPAELKPLVEEMGKVMAQMMTASMKMAQFATDPAVQEASKKLQEVMK